MPRPKLDPTEVTKLELRITPPDGQPITDWKIGDDFNQLIAAEEGGTDDTRLHYHCYIETLRSRSWIVKWIYSIAHCYNGETGNAVFFSRKPHDHTIGYVVKHGNITVRHGCEETFITEWLSKSADYRRAKETERKRVQRIAKSFTQQVFQEIVAELHDDEPATPAHIVDLMLRKYRDANKLLPSRAQVETLVVSVINHKGGDVRAFYLRAFNDY